MWPCCLGSVCRRIVRGADQGRRGRGTEGREGREGKKEKKERRGKVREGSARRGQSPRGEGVEEVEGMRIERRIQNSNWTSPLWWGDEMVVPV